ncbi:MAG: hypothetical protein ACRDOP_02300 [Gaiellaceae bacterium]
MRTLSAERGGSDEDFASPILTPGGGEITCGFTANQLAEVTSIHFDIYDGSTRVERDTDSDVSATVRH